MAQATTFRPGPRSARLPRPRAGVTLVELILALALVVLLAAVAVMAVTPWQRQAALREGTERFATLLRALQAESAGTGRRMRLVFPQAAGQAAASMAVQWEPQPLERPGAFEPYRGALWRAGDPSELVVVVRCRLAGPDGDRWGEEDAFAPILFHPDGSSDWADVSLASRHARDTRRAVVQLNGLTGTIRWTLYADDQYEQPMEEQQ